MINQVMAKVLSGDDNGKTAISSDRTSKEISEGFEKVFCRFINDTRQKNSKYELFVENFLLPVPSVTFENPDSEMIDGEVNFCTLEEESFCALNVEKLNIQTVDSDVNLISHIPILTKDIDENEESKLNKLITNENLVHDDKLESIINESENKAKIIMDYWQMKDLSIENNTKIEQASLRKKVETIEFKGEKGNFEEKLLINHVGDSNGNNKGDSVISSDNTATMSNISETEHAKKFQVSFKEATKISANQEEGFPKKLIDVVIKKIMLLEKGSAEEIQVQSKDETLAEIRLEIVSQEGEDIIKVSTDNENIKNIIEKNTLHIKNVTGKQVVAVEASEKNSDIKNEIKIINQEKHNDISTYADTSDLPEKENDYNEKGDVYDEKRSAFGVKENILNDVRKNTFNNVKENAFNDLKGNLKPDETEVKRFDDATKPDKHYPDFQNLFSNEQLDIPEEKMFKGMFSKEKYIDTIIKEFSVITGNKKKEVELQLKPDFLGKVILKVSSENGNTVARIITESTFAKDLLNSGFSELKEALREQGVIIEELETLPGKGEQFQGQGQSNNWSGNEEKGHPYSKGRYDFNFIEDDKGESLQYAHGYETGIEYYA
jgi:flagellar hook-length control protein FliK